MHAATTCPKCGARIPADAPGGICPNCLLGQGFESTVAYQANSQQLFRPGEPFGQYRIVQLLGKGGMGAVYEAEHHQTGRKVALKVLNHKLQSPEHRQRFLREGRLAASNNHPNTVYIYGTEEIDGVPVISMELVRGGTLQDRVKRDGPLPIGEAVDIILDIIAGLEAAANAGVLHRDVKPSNCFVDVEGTVKVGDFGLSISTAARADTFQTESGVILGTPAFSSPEQLRGDELDVRSDIYSIGVTLYFLLTGQTPFQADQMVRLLATVLERPAPSPRDIRPEIPSGLARVVLRCLAKRSTQRFGDYNELRQALLPYNSTAPTPGTLGFRCLASGIDFIVVASIAALLPLLWVKDVVTWRTHFDALTDATPQPSAELMLIAGAGMLLHLAYFALLEGIWGMAAGKAMCGLRVVQGGGEVAGVLRALVRVSVFALPTWLPLWALYAFDSQAAVAASAGDDLKFVFISLALLLLLFCTVRRRNGYAGLHELVSGTRVIRKKTYQRRPTLSVAADPLPEMQGEPQVGPYHVLGPLDNQSPGLLLAYDTRLLRKVWVRRCTAEAPPVAAELRGLARIGRLRWLNGERKGDSGWDAYEAPSGKPLLSLIEEPQRWDAVRFWLLDLAEELAASLKDHTLPCVLELDRVWVTEDGRAKLLDFPAPGVSPKRRPDVASPPPAADAATAAVFLKRVAIAALEGDVVSDDEARKRNVAAPLPLSARNLLNGLDSEAQEPLPIAGLEACTRRPAAVSLARRLGALAVCWLIPLLMAAYGMTLLFSEKQFLRAHPEVGQLSGFVNYYQFLQERDADVENGVATAELRKALEIVVVDRFRSTITDAQLWSDPLALEFVDAEGQKLLSNLVTAYPQLTPEQVANASHNLRLVREQIRLREWTVHDYGVLLSGPADFLLMVSGLMAAFVILPSLLSAILFRDTLLLRMLEMAVVTKDGEQATRLRMLSRNVILWSLVLAALAALIFIAAWGRPRVIGILIIYWTVSMFTAERGMHDRLAGTWLVPR